ncbi:zinc finger, CCHC-type containing protein [Tanacetum coccineum]
MSIDMSKYKSVHEEKNLCVKKKQKLSEGCKSFLESEDDLPWERGAWLLEKKAKNRKTMDLELNDKYNFYGYLPALQIMTYEAMTCKIGSMLPRFVTRHCEPANHMETILFDIPESVQGNILNGMSDSLFDVYQNVESAKELWDSLESKYLAEDALSKKFLVSNFNNYKMVDSRPVMEQFNELLRIFGQYTQHGLKIDESISVSSVIDKLPPSWKDFKHTLKHGKDDLSLVQLDSHLRIEESLRAQDSDKGKGKEVVVPSVNMTEQGSKNKNNKQNIEKKRGFNKNNSGSGSNKKPKLECWKCGKTGHFKRDCRSGNKKNNANAGGSGKESKDQSYDKGQNLVPVWNRFIKYSVSLISEAFYVQTYEPVEDGSVLYMGDDHFAPVHRKGSVMLEFSLGKSITLFNVLYIPKLRCKWIFKRKMKVDGTIDKFKARLISVSSSSYSQSSDPSNRCQNSILNGDLDEEVYMKQPEGFVMPADVILGIKIKRENKGIVSIQSHYIEKMLKKFNREDCSPVSTPMDLVEKLKPNTGKLVDQLKYSRAIGCLMYAMTSTRPDIAYVVGRLNMFTSNPSRQHWQAITRVFNIHLLRVYGCSSFRGGPFHGLPEANLTITSLLWNLSVLALAATGKEAEMAKKLDT